MAADRDRISARATHRVKCDLLKSGARRRSYMKATRILHDLGQSLWLDNITRNLLRTGVLRRYIEEFSVTGLTSNPTIFDHAIKNSGDYDDAIKSKLAEGKSGEKLFLNSRWKTLRKRRTCSGRFMTEPAASTGGFRWKSRLCWRTTPSRRSPPPRTCTRRRDGPMS